MVRLGRSVVDFDFEGFNNNFASVPYLIEETGGQRRRRSNLEANRVRTIRAVFGRRSVQWADFSDGFEGGNNLSRKIRPRSPNDAYYFEQSCSALNVENLSAGKSYKGSGGTRS